MKNKENTESIVIVLPELCSFPFFLDNSFLKETARLNLENIKNDLPKFRLHFDQDTRVWWKNFLKRKGMTGKVNPKWILPLLEKQIETPNRPLQVSDTTDELFRLIEREERDVEVIFFSLVQFSMLNLA